VISPLIAIGLVFGLIITIIALSEPIVLCYLTITSIVLTSGIERDRYFPILVPNEVILLLSVFIAFLVILINNRRRIAIPSYAIIAFVVLAGGSVFIPITAYLTRGTQLTFNDIFSLIRPLQYILLFWIFATLPEIEMDYRRLIRWMLVCGSIVAIVGLMQVADIRFVTSILNSWYTSSHGAVASEAGRITSLLGAWNALGIFLMVNLLIGWAILPEETETHIRLVLLTSMILSAVALIATGSYAGTLGLLTGILLIEFMLKRWTRVIPDIVLGIVVIAIFVIILFPLLQPLVAQRIAYQTQDGGFLPRTLAFRFEVWRDVFMPPIRNNFPWAVHPTVPENYSWQFEESQYIMLLFRTGMIGLLSYLAWIGITLIWLKRLLGKSNNYTKALVGATLAIFIVMSIAGLTNAVFTYAGASDYLWIMLALVANSSKRSRI
jgi:hypothetical protein